MKLKITAYTLVSMICFSCLAMEKIQMPNRGILNQKLTDVGLDFLVDDKLLVQDIANQKIFLVTLIMRVDFALGN